MTFDEYVKAAVATDRYKSPLDLTGYGDTARKAHAGSVLVNEAGEVHQLVHKDIFDEKPYTRDAIAEELGDTLWAVAVLCDIHKLSLEEVAKANIAKLARRKAEAKRPSARRGR